MPGDGPATWLRSLSAIASGRRTLSKLFVAPDSVAQIQAMAEAHHRSALADLFARGALQAPAETGAR